jgi:alpha-L-fucosidase 2
MRKNLFLPCFSLAMVFFLPNAAGAQTINAKERAQRHAITFNKPAVDFFEGALLGNGGMGVVVNTRPDAIEFHFGHNNVWDIRVAEKNKDKIGTFQEVFEQAKAIPKEYKKISDDSAFGKYMALMGENYAKPYPRPMPCGTVILGFDRRKTELLGHKLDIANGLCEVYLINEGKEAVLQVFTDMEQDQLLFRLIDAKGNALPSFFDWLRLMPDPQTPKEIPKYQISTNTPANVLSFRQVLPYLEPDIYDSISGHVKDKAFRLSVELSNKLLTGTRQDWNGNMTSIGELERYVQPDTTAFVGVVTLEEGLASVITTSLPQSQKPSVDYFVKTQHASEKIWNEYWNKSAVAVSDQLLEETWYRNLYFFNCAVKPGVTCPGLFANWMYGNIGTAWHGDYHMNYNTQQPFWLAFSSNHVDKNLAYTDLVHHILPVSQKWAKEYYGMRGAFFPHSAYPVDMSIMPFPVPDWGWEICETPWTVQGLWWHYLYTQDKAYLKERAYLPIREAVLFLVDYMSRPDAHGKQWGDDKLSCVSYGST